jgi:hypothetical protein
MAIAHLEIPLRYYFSEPVLLITFVFAQLQLASSLDAHYTAGILHHAWFIEIFAPMSSDLPQKSALF